MKSLTELQAQFVNSYSAGDMDAARQAWRRIVAFKQQLKSQASR